MQQTDMELPYCRLPRECHIEDSKVIHAKPWKFHIRKFKTAAEEMPH